MSSFRSRFSAIKWVRLLNVALVCVIADQLSKLWILQTFQPGEIRPVIQDFFNLTLHFNKGAAFGLFAGLEDGYRQVVLGLFSKLAVLLLFFYLVYEFHSSRFGQFCIGLIFGGAVGNLIDRAYRGEVVDFLDFYYSGYHWPAFNVADSCICIGVFLLILFETGNKNKNIPNE
jgi:signal peptidase II